MKNFEIENSQEAFGKPKPVNEEIVKKIEAQALKEGLQPQKEEVKKEFSNFIERINNLKGETEKGFHTDDEIEEMSEEIIEIERLTPIIIQEMKEAIRKISENN